MFKAFQGGKSVNVEELPPPVATGLMVLVCCFNIITNAEL